MQVTQDAINKALNRKRFAWVDTVMKDEIPADIYGSMHSDNLTDRGRASAWLNERGYHVRDCGDGVVQLLRGATVVRQAKLVLELNDPDAMLQVMESAYNQNIPKAPWANDPNL